jgi:hypothetical protein
MLILPLAQNYSVVFLCISIEFAKISSFPFFKKLEMIFKSSSVWIPPVPPLQAAREFRFQDVHFTVMEKLIKFSVNKKGRLTLPMNNP